MSPDEAFEHIAIRYADFLEGHTAYVLALHEQILHFSAGKVADLQLFDKWWSEKCDTLSIRVERSDRAIEILTIHKAKGLENKVIIIPHCSWSMEPMSSGAKPNIVWAKPASHDSLDGIEAFPVSFNSSVGESLFAEAYFREVVYTFVDAINMLYVATTRAGEQLHIFLPRYKKASNKIDNVDNLLLAIYGDKMQEEAGRFRQYTLGTFDRPEEGGEREQKERCSVIKQHHASPISLKLRTSASRYFADEEERLSPRSMGILLHRVFEGATTREEIFSTLEEMTLNGELGEQEVARLRAQIADTLDNTIAGEWFDGSWSALHRERNIIRPKSGSKRPDRVMTRGDEAVVVDYKFGEENKIYNRQIEGYIKELREMGYGSVKGYIWYVQSGNVVEIEGK